MSMFPLLCQFRHHLKTATIQLLCVRVYKENKRKTTFPNNTWGKKTTWKPLAMMWLTERDPSDKDQPTHVQLPSWDPATILQFKKITVRKCRPQGSNNRRPFRGEYSSSGIIRSCKYLVRKRMVPHSPTGVNPVRLYLKTIFKKTFWHWFTKNNWIKTTILPLRRRYSGWKIRL